MNYLDRDLNYIKIIRKRDRTAMYKYKLIRSIIEDLDEYLNEHDLDNFVYKPTLRHIINGSHKRRSVELIKYFTLFGTPFKKRVSINDIINWCHKYKSKHRLYYDEDGKLSYS